MTHSAVVNYKEGNQTVSSLEALFKGPVRNGPRGVEIN